METGKIRKGGAFLVEEIAPQEIFTPDDFTEEHRMIIKTTEDFVKNEVQPHIEELEHKDFELTRKLMRQVGELGLLGADIEEQYGGSTMDKIASLLIAAYFTPAGSFGLTLGAHTGIGTLPVVFFGNKSQKEKYLPALASGEKIAAYALTEPLAGTDALALRTKAILSNDGRYYQLNGEKQFITNGGLADIIITFAKVDGDKFTAFIVEKGFQGVSIGSEESKMGIRGSSTTSVIFEDARVPVKNVLFEIGKGHMVAFSILDIGRLRLAGGCVEEAKLALEESVKYAKQRVQFGKPICELGLIKHKLAEMGIGIYIAESMLYRTAGLIDNILTTVDMAGEDSGRRSAECLSEYATECSINKVYCSEMLDYVADEAVQIHGGYGYIEEYLVERIYRDSRINRIFEGTNEINRLTILDRLMRKALKNEIPLFSMAQRLADEMLTIEPVSPSMEDGPLGYQKKLVDMSKKIFLLTSGGAAQKYGKAMAEQQEILGLLSDIAIEIFAMESGLLRALKSIESSGEEQAKTKIDMVCVYVNDAMKRIDDYATQILAAMETGDVLYTQLGAMRKLSRLMPINTVAVRREIAERLIEAERYTCYTFALQNTIWVGESQRAGEHLKVGNAFGLGRCSGT
ncbi:acyl-CoA dehydrogenase family protein [Dehalococcoidia bacterium]|nr:acyl-CoA dehydrogenase family protein [Dehalococcoidia bacterium]